MDHLAQDEKATLLLIVVVITIMSQKPHVICVISVPLWSATLSEFSWLLLIAKHGNSSISPNCSSGLLIVHYIKWPTNPWFVVFLCPSIKPSDSYWYYIGCSLFSSQGFCNWKYRYIIMDSLQERCSKLLWQCTPRRFEFLVFFSFFDAEVLYLMICYFCCRLGKKSKASYKYPHTNN